MPWSPLDIPSLTYWLPTHNPAWMYASAVGTGANATVGGSVRSVSTQVGSIVADAGADSTRPTLRNDATRNNSLHFQAPSGLVQWMTNTNTLTPLRHFHESGTGYISFWIKCDSVDGTTDVIMDCRNFTSTNKGFSILRTTAEKIQLLVSTGTGSSILSLASGDSIADTSWHRVQVKAAVGASATSIQIDGGAVTTGTLGTLAAGNCVANLAVGARSTGAGSALGQISQLIICSAIPSAGDLTEIGNYNPTDPAAGSYSQLTDLPNMGIGLGFGL